MIVFDFFYERKDDFTSATRRKVLFIIIFV